MVLAGLQADDLGDVCVCVCETEYQGKIKYCPKSTMFLFADLHCLFLLSACTTSSRWSSLPLHPQRLAQVSAVSVSLSQWLSSCEGEPRRGCSCSSAQPDCVLLMCHRSSTRPSPPLSGNRPPLWSTQELRYDSSYPPLAPHLQSSPAPERIHSAPLCLSGPGGNKDCSGKGKGVRWRQAGGRGHHGCRRRAQGRPPRLHLSEVRFSPSSRPSLWLGRLSRPVPRPLRGPGPVGNEILSSVEVWGPSAEAGLKCRTKFPQRLGGRNSWGPDPHPGLLWRNFHILCEGKITFLWSCPCCIQVITTDNLFVFDSSHLLSCIFLWNKAPQRYTGGMAVSNHSWPSSTGEMAAAAFRYELDPDSPK